MYKIFDGGAKGLTKFVLKEDEEKVFAATTLSQVATFILRDLPELAEELAHSSTPDEFIDLEDLFPSQKEEFLNSLQEEFYVENFKGLQEE
ncbi:MAG: hypothetical protein WC905_02755 [Patescibacteria group bacterium]|jgi:hypothetical protein